MNATPETSGSSLHARVQELLPWYVNHALKDEEENFVREHIQHCGECRADAELAHSLRGAAASLEEAVAPNIDRAYEKISRKLDAMQKKPGLFKWARDFFSYPPASPRWMRAALAVQFIAIAGLAALFASDHAFTSSYHVLGSPRSDAANVVVVFQSGTTVADMQKILRANSAVVVNGPTITDAYMLSIPDAQLVKAIARLRAEQAVTLVESLSARSAGN